MKIIKYSDVEPTNFENEIMKGFSGRVVIGKNDGANNFCMRVFEISPGGNTAKHTHYWEHEIFIHSGEGVVLSNGEWKTINSESVVFIPPDEEHQIKNTGQIQLIVICLIPSGVPEL